MMCKFQVFYARHYVQVQSIENSMVFAEVAMLSSTLHQSVVWYFLNLLQCSTRNQSQKYVAIHQNIQVFMRCNLESPNLNPICYYTAFVIKMQLSHTFQHILTLIHYCNLSSLHSQNQVFQDIVFVYLSKLDVVSVFHLVLFLKISKSFFYLLHYSLVNQ